MTNPTTGSHTPTADVRPRLLVLRDQAAALASDLGIGAQDARDDDTSTSLARLAGQAQNIATALRIMLDAGDRIPWIDAGAGTVPSPPPPPGQ